MSDDRPQGSCLVADCPRDPYPRNPGERPPLVCGVCSSRLAGWLRETPDLVAELATRDAPGGVLVRPEIRETLVGWHVPDGWHPPLQLARLVQVEQLLIAGELPAAVTPGATRGGRVSGSAEPRLPVSVDVVDLLAAARTMTSASAPLAYPEQDEDQVGFLSVASTLFTWAEDLREHRGRGEGPPDVAISSLAEWLLNRIDEACADHPAIDELFEDLRKLHGALRAQLGQIEIPDYRHGVPCPKCSALALVRQAGGDWVICSACGNYLKITEYEEYVTMLSTTVTADRREKRKRAAADRLATVALRRGLRAAGWTYRTWTAVEHEVDTGAPLGYRVYRWERESEAIEAYSWPGYSHLVVRYYDDESSAWIDRSLLAAHGVKRLHSLAAAAGVLALPKEQAA